MEWDAQLRECHPACSPLTWHSKARCTENINCEEMTLASKRSVILHPALSSTGSTLIGGDSKNISGLLLAAGGPNSVNQHTFSFGWQQANFHPTHGRLVEPHAPGGSRYA